MIEDELRHALAGLADGLPPRQAAAAVERLMGHYRGRTPTSAPVLRDRADVVAYAAYRMPATFGAVRAALAALAERTGAWRPASHLDVGGGTGAAVWAAAAVWDEDGSADGTPDAGQVRRTTVLDWSEAALDVGRLLAASAGPAAPRGAEWLRRSLRARDRAAGGQDGAGGEAAGLPAADLVTVSYVLGELAEADRADVVAAAARAGQVVVVAEPGSREGHARVLAAREGLLAAGLRVLAPCPHGAACPLAAGGDWCHLAARINRSALHRRAKGGSLGYEDEKYSYVAAARPAVPGTPAPARIVRRPQLPKGQALLDLCTAEDGLRRDTVTRRHGAPVYRAARDAVWGDAWPPAGAEG